MIINRDENITIITQENTEIKTLITNIEASYNKHKDYHLIIKLSSLEPILAADITEFLKLSNTHRGAKKSFVIVSENVNLDETPDEIVVVPTLQEAYDIIEMEDIERDLGF